MLDKLHRYRNEAYHQDRVHDSTIEPAVHFLQLDDASPGKPEQLRSCEVPFTMDGLANCRERAAKVSELSDPIDAFRAYAEIEDEFEKVEEALADLLARFDYAIRSEVDRMRGK